jgi:DNA-binding CsgD family transcriptional regulator
VSQGTSATDAEPLSAEVSATRLGAVRTALEEGRAEQAIELGTALSAVLDDPSDRATLHFLLGRAELFNGRIAPATQRFRLAELATLLPVDRMRISVLEAFSRYGSGGLAAIDEVVEELERDAHGEPFITAAVTAMRAWIAFERGQETRSIELAVKANRLAVDLGDDDLAVLSHLLLGLTLCSAGQLEAARQATDDGIKLSTQSGHGLVLPLLHMSQADINVLAGRFDRAAHSAQAAIDSSEPISAGLVGVWGHGILAMLADRMGHDAAARNHVVDAERALLRGTPLGWGHLSVARLRVDRADDATRTAQRLLDVWRYISDHGTSTHPIVFTIPTADLSLRLTDRALTGEIESRLAIIDTPNDFESMQRDFALAVIRRDAELVVELADAIASNTAAARITVGDVLAIAADFSARHGVPRDARTYANRAREIFESLGAHGDLRRLISRHPSTSRPGDQVLSSAEGRVVALVTAGRTNAQIAAELYLSIKTVESHLARVYRRFGVKSRTQLVSHLQSLPN